jgi:hypothetical protein
MGGTTQQKNTTTAQNQTSAQTQQQQQQSQQQQQQSGATSSALTPWAGNAGLLNSIFLQLGGIPTGLTPTETNALNQWGALAGAGNPYAGPIGGVANTLLAGGGPDRSAMVNNAYQQYQATLNPYLGKDYLNPYNTPGFSDALNAVNSDITNQINGMFAGAGRDLSGLNVQSLARGLSQGEGGLIQNQYNQNVASQLGAANSLYGAGNSTAGLLSNLDQTRLANMQAGINAADAANNAQIWGPQQMLQVEAARRGIPLEALQQEYGMVMPAAQAFGTQSGTTSGASSGAASGSSYANTAGTQQGTEQSTTTQSTPFNWLSLAPLAFAPLTGGTSLAGMGASALGGGLFSSLSNGFLGGGNWLSGAGK